MTLNLDIQKNNVCSAQFNAYFPTSKGFAMTRKNDLQKKRRWRTHIVVARHKSECYSGNVEIDGCAEIGGHNNG
jgi:hypothetical protein